MADKSKPAVVFRALQLANEQRNAYGLRYNDFARYRKHCANRTHRLRSTLKMTHGKGREFKKLPPLSPEIVKGGHLQLLLFETERAWAYAQELTNSALEPANKDNASGLRHSATGRFRRAVNWSTQLLSLCQVLYASSRLVARALLDNLADASSTSRDQALAVLFSDEIGPEIRYCAHELGRPKAYDINGIVAELAPKYRNEIVENCDALVAKLQTEERTTSLKSKLTERVWEGQPVPVRYPELVDVLLRVEKAEAHLNATQWDSDRPHAAGRKSKLGATAYDAVLSALSDAEDVARKLQEAQQLAGTGANSSVDGGRDIHFVHAYIVYQLLSRRIQRDLLLMNTLLTSETSDNPKERETKKTISARLKAEPVDSRLYPAIVKLLDTVLQSLTQMRTLSIVDDNPDLASAVEARVAFTNGRRCLYLARCYSAVKKYAEALALLQHATIHVRETISSLSLSESDLITNAIPPFFPLKPDDIKGLESTIISDGSRYKQDWFAHNGGSVKADPATYKKPVFFNIALNYVELDMDRLQQRAGKQPVLMPPTSGAAAMTETAPEKKQTSKAKAEEHVEFAPETQQPSRSGLSSLLGGWWSK
ncbi:hypothetical protein BDZ97DRAFT_1787309 [Flammula alnicola]|nr:hypothetical protein BDZ97DRAFT_1787309 [Flammula alnicola]